MSSRYFGKVLSVQDKFTVVINIGSNHDLRDGQKFLVVGLGEIIIDPDTKEELERLEVVRGRAQVVHIQEKIATLRSCDFDRARDVTEVKKVTSRSLGVAANFFGPQDTVTESVKPGEERLKELAGVQIGDLIIRL
jgi:hypothetical protein